MIVAEIMTKSVFSVSPTSKVRELAAQLRDKKVSAAPVLDGDTLVGIVTEADILSRKPGQNLVRSIMRTNVLTVTEHTDVKEVAGILARKRMTRLPVVKDRKLVGMVSAVEVLKAMGRQPTRRVAPTRGVRSGGAH